MQYGVFLLIWKVTSACEAVLSDKMNVLQAFSQHTFTWNIFIHLSMKKQNATVFTIS